MSSSPSRPRVAYFEEYSEEAHATLPETRQTANIAAKRSKPDIEKLKLGQSGRDEASDSGYSSHTVATAEIPDPPPGPKKGNPPLKVDTSLAISKIKSEGAATKSARTPKSAQKPTLRRTESKARDGKNVLPEDCNCDDCKSKAPRSATRKGPRPLDYPSTRPKPEAPAPPKPTQASLPKPIKEAAVLQPAPARPRANTMHIYRAVRPVSFHGGLMPDPVYLQQPGFVDQRSMSTFPISSPFPPPLPPPKPTYFPSNVQLIPQRPPHPPLSPFNYEPPLPPPPRPQPRQWTSELHPPGLPPVIYSPSPVIEYPQPQRYAHSVPTSHSLPHRPMVRPAPLSEEPYFLDEDSYLMPPPPPPPPKMGSSSRQYRPAIRHAATTSTHPTLNDRRTVPIADVAPEYLRRRSPRRSSPEKMERFRRPSVTNRPSHASATEKPSSHYPPPRVRIESGNGATAAAKQRRRASYYGHETPNDLEREVEAYQASKSHVPSPPIIADFSADSLMVRKKTNHGGSSDAGSRVSGEGRGGSRDGSEVKSRSSTDRRSDMKTRSTANDNDGITMRFNASQGVSVDVQGGGVEGRTISLRPSTETEGGMELSIGARGRGGNGSNGGREKSRRRNSYLDGGRELEYAQSVVREGDTGREREREKERKIGPSRSRRSSRNGYSGRLGLDI